MRGGPAAHATAAGPPLSGGPARPLQRWCWWCLSICRPLWRGSVDWDVAGALSERHRPLEQALRGPADLAGMQVCGLRLVPVHRVENLGYEMGCSVRTVWSCVVAGLPLLVEGGDAKQVRGDVLEGMAGVCLVLAPGKVGRYCLPMGFGEEAGLLETRGLQSLAVSSHSLAVMGAVRMGGCQHLLAATLKACTVRGGDSALLGSHARERQESERRLAAELKDRCRLCVVWCWPVGLDRAKPS